MPKDYTASVLNLGASLGKVFENVGKTIEEEKNKRVAADILSRYRDPKKTFLKEDGTLRNPFDIINDFSEGMADLVSIGKKDEAAILQNYLKAGLETGEKQETNRTMLDIWGVKNEKEAQKLIEMGSVPNLPWLNSNRLPESTGSAKKAYQPQWSKVFKATSENEVEGFDVKPGEYYIMQTQLQEDGSVKVLRVLASNDPNTKFSVVKMTGGTTQFNASNVRIKLPNGETYVTDVNGKVYKDGKFTGKYINDPQFKGHISVGTTDQNIIQEKQDELMQRYQESQILDNIPDEYLRQAANAYLESGIETELFQVLDQSTKEALRQLKRQRK